MFFKWFIINIHLVPSLASFVAGLVFLMLAPLKYMTRTDKDIILNPFAIIAEYNKTETRLFFMGMVLLIVGLVSLTVITSKFGYYYFNGSVPTLTN